MNSKPKISVIMAVHNGEKYLAEAIESILNQTFEDFEFIIIDDSSKDNSLKIIKEYAKKDSKIKIIKNNKNLKLAGSLNRGLKIAKGKYIARMDADDISLPERLEIQYSYLEENKDIFLVGTSWITINSEGKQISKTINNFNFKKINERLPYKSLIHHPTVMFRNEHLFYRDKFFYAQDRDFWLRFLSNNKKMEVVPKPLIKWRVNEKSVSIQKAFMQKFFVDKSIEFYFQRLNLSFDSYENFDPRKELKKFKQSEIKQFNNKAKLVFYFKENIRGGNQFRKRLIHYWKEYKYSSWKISILYYLMSYMPKNIIKFSNQIIDKFYIPKRKVHLHI